MYLTKTYPHLILRLTYNVQYLFPSKDSPKYIMGFSVISSMLAVGVSVFLFMHFWFRRRLQAGLL